MHNSRQRSTRSVIIAMLLAGAALSAATLALAGSTLRSATASPDVYKVLTEDKGMRVILATWQPGQRDQWHSHPVMAVYWLAGCDARIYLPDGTHTDVTLKTGQAGVQKVIESHSFENLSSSECKALMVEQE
jgi:quercetin dioxygenase-like cupin family protein